MSLAVKIPAIQSIGTSVPPNKVSQDLHYSILESANGMSREDKLRLRKIYNRSGIKYRYSVLDEFENTDESKNILFHPANHHAPVPVSQRMGLFEHYAAELCEKAIKKCFEELPSLTPSQITHLITFSCTGMYAPGLDIQLVGMLGLPLYVERTCINFMGCYAGINALKTANHISRSQPDAIVLVVGVELCTLHYRKSEEQDQVVANSLFADGAAACIVASKNIEKKKKSPNLLMQNFYAEFDPSGNKEMVWRIGDFGFDLRLSSYVPELIRNSIYSLTQKLFNQADISQADIDYYALHPGGMKILEACEEALHISKEQNKISYDVLRDYGNMSSVTILFVLEKYMETLSAKDDREKKILACAFGPGLTMESMIAEIY
ncbi:MAG: type III polyketide synthase [Bacteroidia bacterium]